MGRIDRRPSFMNVVAALSLLLGRAPQKRIVVGGAGDSTRVVMNAENQPPVRDESVEFEKIVTIWSYTHGAVTV